MYEIFYSQLGVYVALILSYKNIFQIKGHEVRGCLKSMPIFSLANPF